MSRECLGQVLLGPLRELLELCGDERSNLRADVLKGAREHGGEARVAARRVRRAGRRREEGPHERAAGGAESSHGQLRSEVVDL